MHDFAIQALTIFMGFFAIMNPIANVPVFLGLTSEDDEETTRSIARRSVLLAFIVVTIFILTGKLIFDLFGITLPAFRITGGVLVFLIGFHMLQGNQSSVHQPKEGDHDKFRQAALSVAVSPLAMPILAGPGTIATAMNFSARGGVPSILLTICTFALLCFITYLFFVFGEKLVTYLGVGALGMITRMMGLILAVIGVQMLIEGIAGAIRLVQAGN